MKYLKLSLISIFTIFIISCKNSENKIDDSSLLKNKDSIVSNLAFEANTEDTTTVNANTDKLKQFQGVWFSYKFIEDKRYSEKFDENYAREISNYLSFSIKSDSLIVPNWCKTSIYKYNYPTKFKKYEEESIFITYFKPKSDSLTFISSYNTSDLGCEKPYKTICFINDELVIHDRGYFFFYRKDKNKQTNNEFTVIGIPADNRNPWEVKKTYTNLDFNEAYQDFKSNFSFGGLNLVKEIPSSNYFDKTNDINYEITDKNIVITKANPMGTIIISLFIKNNKLHLLYKMEYSDEG